MVNIFHSQHTSANTGDTGNVAALRSYLNTFAAICTVMAKLFENEAGLAFAQSVCQIMSGNPPESVRRQLVFRSEIM